MNLKVTNKGGEGRSGGGLQAKAIFSLIALFSTSLWAADPLPIPAPAPVAPPTAPPVQTRAGSGPQVMSMGLPGDLYSIGSPTDEEQLYLEYINRARANPAAEGARLRDTTDPSVRSAYTYFNVDLNLMVTQMSALSAAPPLSMSGPLSLAARGHSCDMLTNNFQGHYGTDGSDPGVRITRQGYSWSTYGENVYASASAPFHGHAGFEVDWGNGPGGMQTPAGHRTSIHNASFREVGVGVINGSNGGVGPQLVTQDFSTKFSSTPFVTGVAYYDLNGNNFYDVGEGIGGVEVSVSGTAAWAVTADSGGYSVPVAGNGSYTVTFEAPEATPVTTTAVVSSGKNVKADYTPVYTAPVLVGPAQAATGQDTAYTFNTIGAATAYQLKRSRRIAFAGVEGAEGGLGNMTATTSAGYAVVVNDVKANGSSSFHLAHPQPTWQILSVNRLIRPSASSQVMFASRLGWATAGQVGRLQVSTNGGVSWTNLWSAAGTGTAGQSSFSRITNSLGPFAGREIQLRFNYDFSTGSYYPGVTTGVGWYVDDVSFTGAEELTETVVSDVASPGQVTFNPAGAGDYLLRVHGRVGARCLDYGPGLPVSAVTGPVRLRIKTSPAVVSANMQFEFELVNQLGATFQLETATSPAGPWVVNSSATFQNLVPNLRWRASVARNADGTCFYRIVAR